MRNKILKQILGVLFLLFIFALFLSPVDSEAQIRPQKRYVMLKPDLSVAIIDPPPSAQPVSTHILSSIRIRIENNGKASTGDSFYVYLFLTKGKAYSPKQLILHVPLKSQSWNENPIGNGSSVTRKVHNIKYGIPDNLAPGLYYLGVTVDQKNKIDEINEKNNSATLQIKIEGISISSVHQTCDHIPGICIWLMGKGFGNAPGSKIVRMGPVQLTPNMWSDTEAEAYTNSSQIQISNTYDIYMVNSNTNAVITNIVPKKITARFTATTYQASPGEEISVYGCQWGQTQGTKKVKIGNTEAQVIEWSTNGTGGKILVPSLLQGNYLIYLEESGQVISNKVTFKIL